MINNPNIYELPTNSAIQTSLDLSNDIAPIDLFLEKDVREFEINHSKSFLSSLVNI